MMYAILPLLAVLQAGAAQTGKEEAVRLETATGVLHGTLLLPAKTSGKVPVVLIIAGSGPTDRDGNSPVLPGKNESLKMVAQALAAEGIASLRYDKRGIAASMSAGRSEMELRFNNYIDDAAGWIKMLRSDARFSTVTVAGHSEGSLIGMQATAQAQADGFISIAGIGRPLHAVITEQLERGAPPAMRTEAARIMTELRQGRTVADVDPTFLVLFRPSVQPYLISQLTIEPTAEIGKLRVPVLIVQGTTDVQVSVTDAQALARGYPRARLELIDGMNHALKEVREASEQVGSYSNPNLPLHAALAPALVRFVRQIEGGKG